MVLFWFITIILTTVALLGLVWPFLRQQNDSTHLTREQLNKLFYNMRLKELAQEQQIGVIAQQQDLATELQLSLLDDVPEQLNHSQQQSQINKGVILLFGFLLIFVSYSSYLRTGHNLAISTWQQVLTRAPELSKKLEQQISSNQATLTAEEISNLKLIVRTELQSNRDDKKGWLLLANLGAKDNDFDTYFNAAQRAYQLDPNNGFAQKIYGQAQLESGDNNFKQAGLALLSHYILNHPDDLSVLSQLAFYYFSNNNFPLAINYWKQMLPKLDPQSERYNMVQKGIEMAMKGVNK